MDISSLHSQQHHGLTDRRLWLNWPIKSLVKNQGEFNTIVSRYATHFDSARVVGTSVTVNNSPIQDYVHLDGHPQPTHVKYNNYAEICDRPAKHPVYDFSPCSAAWSNCSLCLLFKLLCLQSNTGKILREMHFTGLYCHFTFQFYTFATAT